MRLGVALLLITTAVAGCLSDADEADRRVRGIGGSLFDPEWHLNALPWGDAHDHADASQHVNLSTPNFKVIAHNPLAVDEFGGAAGGYGCSSTVENAGRTLSITNSFVTDVSLIVTDVTDRTAPEVLGELVLENTHVYDNVLTPDNQYALLAVTPFGDGPTDELPLPAIHAEAKQTFTWRDACTGDETLLAGGPEDDAPWFSGVLLVDLSDPTDPTIADYVPQPVYGAHSIRAHRLGELDLVVSSVAGAGSAGVGGAYGSYWMFWEVQQTPAGGKLVPQGAFYPPDHATGYAERVADRAVHDAYVQIHPVTGERVGYFADIDKGAYIVNLDDLAQPQILSHWDPEEVFGFPDFITHGLQPIEDKWNDRHYTIGHEECAGRRADLPTCLSWIMDTTDPANPLTIGAWTLPVDVPWEGLLTFSLHYTGIDQRTLFQSNYHGGVWAIDLSEEALAGLADDPSLQSIGVFIPAAPEVDVPGPINAVIRQLYGDELFELRPMVMDMDVLLDGSIVLYDMNSGLWVLDFDHDDPAPAPEPWPLGDMFSFDARPS